jgi:hypothetical protein
VIPTVDSAEIWCTEPTETVLPSPESVWSDEGIGGGYRDTWCLAAIGVADAQAGLVLESELLGRADGAATDAHGFDAVCKRLERGGSEDDDPDDDDNWEPPELASLEVGIAGLVFTLNALGMPTVASCRGHPGGWSEFPIVHFAAELSWAKLTYQVTAATSCGFLTEDSGDLTIWAKSVADTHRLAQNLLAVAAGFEALGQPFHLRREMWEDDDAAASFFENE